MKTILIALFAVLALTAHGQTTVTAPSATSYEVTLSWTLGADCTTTTPCLIVPYRQPGTSCPSTIAGTTGWTQLAATAQQATSAVDTTVTPGTSYEYFVEAEYPSGTSYSGPSNCIVVAVPLVPVPPSGVTGSVN